MSQRLTKPTKWNVSPVKTEISLGIHSVWSVSLLCAQWVAKDPSFVHGDSEVSDQTGQLPRLTCLPWAHISFCRFCHGLTQILCGYPLIYSYGCYSHEETISCLSNQNTSTYIINWNKSMQLFGNVSLSCSVKLGSSLILDSCLLTNMSEYWFPDDTNWLSTQEPHYNMVQYSSFWYNKTKNSG